MEHEYWIDIEDSIKTKILLFNFNINNNIL